MALEDAAALEVLLANMTPNDDIPQRLQLWQQVRLPRCATSQLLSNAMFYSKDMDQEELVRKYYKGPLPPPGAKPWSEPIRDFFYPYDVFEESKKALQHQDTAGSVQDGVLKYFGLNDGSASST